MHSRIDTILSTIGSILLAFIAFLLLAQILGRYFLSIPWPWTEEMARYTLIWVSFLGAWIGVRHKAHFRVEELEQWFAKFGGRWVQAIISATALCVITYGGFFILPRVFGTRSPVLEWSMTIVYAPVAILSGVMAIETLLDLLRKKR